MLVFCHYNLSLAIPGILFNAVDVQVDGVYVWLINVPSIIIVVFCSFAFMLIINGGYALRWLYQNKANVLVRYNLHVKAGSVYSYVGMLGTGIGVVQCLRSLHNIESIFPAAAVAVLTNLCGVLFFHAPLVMPDVDLFAR